MSGIRFSPVFAVAVALISGSIASAEVHWEAAGLSGAGLFPAIAVDPAGSGLVYLASDVAGVYRSRNHGDSWQAASSGLPSLQVASLALDTSTPETVWAGTPLGLCVSSDAGASWQVIADGVRVFKHINYRAIALHTSGATLLVAGSDLPEGADGSDDSQFSGVLHRSTDRGSSWQRVRTFPSTTPSVAFDPDQADRAFLLVAGQGVLVSQDAGATWQDFSSGLPDDRAWKSLEIGGGTIWITAGPIESGALAGVYRSSTDSADWSAIDEGLVDEDNDLALAEPIRRAPGSPATLYLGQNGWPSVIYTSRDNGNSWQGLPVEGHYSADPVHAPHSVWTDPLQAVVDIAVDPSRPGRVYSSSWWSMWRSDDGGANWDEKVAGAQNTCTTDVHVGSGFWLATTMDGGIDRSLDGGATWVSTWPTETLPQGEWMHAWSIEEAADGTIYFGAGSTRGAQIHRSTDDGVSWHEVSNGLPGSADLADPVFSQITLAADPGDADVVWATVDQIGVYRSGDRGESWQLKWDLRGANGEDEPVVKSVEVDPGNSSQIFVGSYWGGIWRSADGGDSWSASSVTGGPDDQSVQRLVALPDGRIFAALADGLYLSVDAGASFSRRFPATPQLGEDALEYLEAIAVDPSDPQHLVAASARRYPAWFNLGSVWESHDSGTSWDDVTGDLPFRRVTDLAFDGSSIAASTWCAHVWSSELAPLSAVDLEARSLTTVFDEVASGGGLLAGYRGAVTGQLTSSFELGFYLSTDAALDPSDILLGRVEIDSAPSGGEEFASDDRGLLLTLPESAPVGVINLLMRLDDASAIDESDEANNILATEITIRGQGDLPSLQASACSIESGMVAAGESVTLSWRGRNLGGTGAPQVQWDFLLSSDSTIEAADLSLGSGEDLDGWPAGHDTGAIGQLLQIPANQPPGTSFLGVLLDPNELLAEAPGSTPWCAVQIEVIEGDDLEPAWIIPAAASAPGLGDSDWRTELSIVNPTVEPRRVSLSFVARGEAWPGGELEAARTLAPKERWYLGDVLAAVRPATGLLYVNTDGAGIVASSRTFNLSTDGGTFGQGIAAVALSDSAPTRLVLPILHSSPGRFHSNLGLLQSSAGSFTVEIDILDADGSILASGNFTRSGAWDQITDVFDALGLGDQDIEAAWAELRLIAGSPRWWGCYASIIDERTGDPTYILPIEPTEAP